MFDLDLDMLFEGEQADAYMNRKVENKRKEEEAKYKRYRRRDGADDGHPEDRLDALSADPKYKYAQGKYRDVAPKKIVNEYDNKREKIKNQAGKLHDVRKRAEDKYYNSAYKDPHSHVVDQNAIDAIARHERRHGTKESVLIDLMEDIQFADIMVNDIESDID